MNKDSVSVLNLQRLKLLIFIVVLMLCIKSMLVLGIGGPVYFFDELKYRLNAFSIYNGVKYATSHYPPIYSLAIAPAFVMERWYEGMLLLNVLWSSMLMPAVYFLGCSIKLRHPLVAAVLVALLPLHVVYPRYILSENIFVPLFVISFAFAIRGSIGGKFESFLFGLSLGLAHLARYLFLPSLPLFICAWFMILLVRRGESCFDNRFDIAKHICCVAAGYGLLISVWVFIGFESGFSLKELFGFGVSGVTSGFFDVDTFLMWCVLYASYVFLMSYPVWMLFCFYLALVKNMEIRQISNRNALIAVLLFVLVVCYWLIAARHSGAAKYNSVVPLYIIGRYLMHLVPVALVFYVWILEKIVQDHRRFSMIKAFFLVAVLSVLGEICRRILFGQLIWDLPTWFATISFNATDVFNFYSPLLVVAYTLSIFVTIVIIYVGVKDVRFIVLPLAVVLLFNAYVSCDRLTRDDRGFHSREVFEEFSKYFESRKFINLIVDDATISLKILIYGFNFWNIFDYQMNIDVFEKFNFDLSSFTGQTYLVSSSLFNADVVRKYVNNDKTYSMYKITNENMLGLRPQIVSINPSSTQSNLGFNTQPTGNSALGLTVSSVSTRAFLKFNNERLALAQGADGFVSAEIPHNLLASPGVVKIRISDPLTGLESDDVEFLILP
jgi:hypothetical protein